MGQKAELILNQNWSKWNVAKRLDYRFTDRLGVLVKDIHPLGELLVECG